MTYWSTIYKNQILCSLVAFVIHFQRASSSEAMKKPTQYHFKRVLGYGASGTVYEAALRDKPDASTSVFYARCYFYWHPPQCTAAIKCIQFRGDTRLRKIAKEEAELHVKLQHPCVLQFLGVDETSEECYIALELCTRGSLHSFLFTNAHAK
jgi:serine/threonine protein kinase